MHKNTKTYCSDCGVTHTPIMCFNKPRKQLKPVTDKTLQKKQFFDRTWFELNPCNEKGIWFCYLRISPDCQPKVTRSTINLEHAYTKTRHPEWKYCLWNVYPSCQPCNKLKASKDIDEFDSPHLKKLVKKLAKYTE